MSPIRSSAAASEHERKFLTDKTTDWFSTAAEIPEIQYTDVKFGKKVIDRYYCGHAMVDKGKADSDIKVRFENNLFSYVRLGCHSALF